MNKIGSTNILDAGRLLNYILGSVSVISGVMLLIVEIRFAVTGFLIWFGIFTISLGVALISSKTAIFERRQGGNIMEFPIQTIKTRSKKSDTVEPEIILMEDSETAIKEDELLEEIVLEESVPPVKRQTRSCPYCNSAKTTESVANVAKNKGEVKLIRVGKCGNCSKLWYSVDDGNQVPKPKEPHELDQKIDLDI